MKAKSNIPQYFSPALCDNWSWKPICGLFESGRFTQVLLYNLSSQGNNQMKTYCDETEGGFQLTVRQI